MSGETNLETLLHSMQPSLKPEEYVFCTVSPAQWANLTVQPIGLFQEEEGITLILPKVQADQSQLPYEYVAHLITLSVHSSLSAIGFLAAITTRLAAQGISVNPVSAYYHDHLFVPVDRSAEALRLLTTWTA